MTYAQFLAFFVSLPGLALLLYLLVSKRRTVSRLGWAALMLHIGIAVAYTTPWDNYLVRSGVWWYETGRVWGITLGWVPLEEYLFFVFQTILTGSLALIAVPQASAGNSSREPLRGLQRISALTALLVAALFTTFLVLRVEPVRYLALIVVWALPPIALQFLFGADILIRHHRTVIPLVLLPTVYLSLADSLAIRLGIWTISPRFSTGLLLGGLPIEEALFFLVTNSLIVFGMTLVLSPAGQERGLKWIRLLQDSPRLNPTPTKNLKLPGTPSDFPEVDPKEGART